MALTIPGVEPDQNETLAAVERETGPSNFLRLMARRPEAMQDFARFYARLMSPGTIDHRLKEMVYLAVSTVNECKYCTSHHIKTGLLAGLSAQEMEEISTEQNQNFNAREVAALHYARELTRHCSVDSDTRDALHEMFSGEQIVELTMVIALANFTNRFNNGLSVPLEDQTDFTRR